MEQEYKLWKIKMDSLKFDGVDYQDDSFEIIAMVLQQLSEEGEPWEDLIETCLLASAFCAQEAELHPDDYMTIIRSVKVTEEGIYGDA